jgi:ribosomal protein S18 acetylase RimI-like enzyme
MTPPVHHFRLAGPDDAVAIRALDNLAFPADQPDQVRAEPGELEAGVAAGDVHVVVRDGVIAGYLHADASRAGRIYVAGVAVRPDLQGQGLGSALIDQMLAVLGAERHLTPVVTVTSPFNVRMLKTLFRRGFSARWFIRDHFGPGHHRLGCQLLTDAGADPQSAVGPVIRVRATHLDEICERVQVNGMRVRAIDGATAATAWFELVPAGPNDFLAADPPDHFIDPSELPLDLLNRAIRDNLGSSHNDRMW